MKKRALKTATAFILAVSLVLSGGGIEKCNAAVSDNIGIAKIEEKLGSYSDSAGSQSLFGVIWSIFNYAKDVFTKVQSLETKIDSLAKKMDGIDISGGAVAPAYSLSVYIPKASAATDYTGQTVSLSSPTGDQTAVATLADDGTNYSACLKFDFNGACTLSYNLLDSDGASIKVSSSVTVSETGQEQRLGLGLGNPYSMSWAKVHMVLQNGLMKEYGLNVQGTMLGGGNWYVITATKNYNKDSLMIWIGDVVNASPLTWDEANDEANDYYNIFNTNAGIVMAYASGLPLESEVKVFDQLVWNLPTDWWLYDDENGDHLQMHRSGYASYCDSYTTADYAPYVFIR